MALSQRVQLTDGMGSFLAQLPRTRSFLSTELTGSGAEESVAHGLATVPTSVLVFQTGDTVGAWSSWSIVEGTHTATNVLVTVSGNILYRVLALV